MPATPNPLSDMAKLDSNIDSEDERPNATFIHSALPGFKKTIKARRAIRIFDGAPIPEKIMHDCFNDGILAPSASNLQSYEFYWVRDEQMKKQLATYCLEQPAATTAGELVVVVARVDKWKSHLKMLTDIMTLKGEKPLEGPIKEYYEKIVPMLMRTDRFGFHNLIRRLMFWYRGKSEPTPHEPVRRADHRIYGHIQSSLAAENFMLSLAAHGYESCPIGGIDKRSINALLNLPPSAEVTMVIGAGTGKPEGLFSQRARLSFDELVKEI